MRVFRGFHHPGIAPACALTIGNFDGVHRGHQAMLALLRSEAQHRGLPSCVMTFEPHPRDYFARLAGKPEHAKLRKEIARQRPPRLARERLREPALGHREWLLRHKRPTPAPARLHWRLAPATAITSAARLRRSACVTITVLVG